MKKISLFALVAAGMLLGACSDKEEVVQGNSDNLYDLIPGKNSWLAVGIALPDGGSSTRANEDLVDTVSTEYQVKSAKLILFKGGTEATATFFAEEVLTPASFSIEEGDSVPQGNKEGTTSDGFGEITSSSTRYVTQITNPNLGAEDKLWAYVILNYDGNSLGSGATASGKTFAEFSRERFQAIGIENEVKGQGAIGSNGLVMTSVPISSGAGGPSVSTDPAPVITTLSQIQSNAIFETKEDAEKATNPLTCIYVERAAVKVELINSVTTLDNSDVTFSVTGWSLGNINNGGGSGSGYYNTRQFNSDWIGYNNLLAPTNTKYRMLGRAAFWTTANNHNSTGYRTYFGEDVNYDGNTGLINNTLVDGDNSNYVNFNTGEGAKNILYTYENTIDENSMIYENTTYVGIRAQIGNADFWVEEGQPKTKLNSTDDIGTRVKANASTTFDNAIGQINAAISADLNSTSSTIIAAGEKGANSIDKVTYDLGAKVTLGSVSSTTAEQSYTYQITISNIVAMKNGSAVTGLSTAQQTAIEDAVKALTDVAAIINPTDRTNTTKFYLYHNGVSYYSMRIAHFGGSDINSGDKEFKNGETPWSAPSSAYNNYNKIYPFDGKSSHEGTAKVTYSGIESTTLGRASAWLGRWSIVRNNWYVLDIQKVEGLGSPVPEDYSGSGIGNTPDDNPGREYYIAAEIHVLPWAKRYQSVSF